MTILDDEFPMMMEREAGMPDWVPPVAVGFGNYHQIDQQKTIEAGHEVYVDAVFVKIAVPGDRDMTVLQPATDLYRKRFPQAWAAFTAREAGAETTEGLPIHMWAPITRATALTLRACNIFTVEQLAEVHDGNIDGIGTNGRELREKARAFIKQAKDSAAALSLAADKRALQDQIAALQAQITALASAREGENTELPSDAAAAARKPRKQ